MRSAITAVVTLCVAVLLAGCATSASPSSSAGASASAPTTTTVPTPEPSATVAAAATVVLTGSGLHVEDADGAVLSEHLWTGPVGDTVAALEAAFGDAPSVTEYPQTSTHGERVDLAWVGFTLSAQAAFDTSLDGSDVTAWVDVSAADVSDVAIRSASGVSVGMPEADVMAAGAVSTEEIDYALDPEDPAALDTPDGYTKLVEAVVEGGSVVLLRAPMGNVGNM